MKPVIRLPALAALLLPLACVTADVSPQDQSTVSQKYTGQKREIATSLFATKFFVEKDRKLLSLQPPDEVDILDDTDGKPIYPGLAQEVIPAGAKVTIVRVGFPGGSQNFSREFTTPRDRIWVDLEVEGKPETPWYTLVLRPDLKTPADIDAEVDKWLTDKPLDTEISALPPADRTAIATKELVPGPSARALELAFGTPLNKKIDINGATRREDWTWKSDTIARTAHLLNGVVVSVEGPPVKHEAATTAAK